MEFLVDLNKVEDVKLFVKTAEFYDVDVDVHSQNRKFTVDGASIMGLFSLDLSTPVIVYIEDIEAAESFKNDIDKLIVE